MVIPFISRTLITKLTLRKAPQGGPVRGAGGCLLGGGGGASPSDGPASEQAADASSRHSRAHTHTRTRGTLGAPTRASQGSDVGPEERHPAGSTTGHAPRSQSATSPTLGCITSTPEYRATLERGATLGALSVV
ncbi:unnamed protein product [Ixodes pacificus]